MRCLTFVFSGLTLFSQICCAQTTYTCINANGDATTSTKPCFGLTAKAIQSSFGNKKQSNYTLIQMSPGALKVVEASTREEDAREKADRAAAAAKVAQGNAPIAGNGTH
jgi:hypothetical protein